ncbi:hypothetical protein JY494_12115 [Serratia marcescens]|uniref:hypothetical protein n=1 Tax=Serratia nevei TaxID=2703794 RepID=UPI00313D293A|nr:hypothetical protein [Serratia marcescens]
MKRPFATCLLCFLLAPTVAQAASTQCSSKAADVYYSKLMNNDKLLSVLRSGGKGISPVELSTLNGLIYSCEKGIEDKTYNTKKLWSLAYDDAKKNSVSEDLAIAYADATVELYSFGVALQTNNHPWQKY